VKGGFRKTNLIPRRTLYCKTTMWAKNSIEGEKVMRKKFKKLVAMVLSLAILATFCAVPMTASAEDKNLKFGDDGKFKIVVFSDVQVQYPAHQRLITIMEQALEREKPDLVVFNGDMTEMNTKDPEVDLRRTVEQILAPVVEAGVPYSIVFGNHDVQGYNGNVDKEAVLSVYQSIGDCRTTDPAPELTGTGTCKIPIYASNGSNVAFNLWMVDSNSWQNPSNYSGGYDNPHADQLAWMQENNDAGVNSLVFQHIPMPEIYNLLVEDENGDKTYGDKTYTLELNANATGELNEFPNPCPADKNTGEFDALKEMGNVLGVFTGHDHFNNFTGTYEGIDMTAIPGMTYFAYGKEEYRGYGVIELDESNLSDYDYHSVKFSTLDAEFGNASSETTFDAYDEITYSDLKMNGQPVGDSFTINGTHDFTYEATSPSYSAIFKFRWTAGTKQGMQFSFDKGEGGNISYPFGVWIKKPTEAGPNGEWHLNPTDKNLSVPLDAPISQGDTFDIEFGRLKILAGAPERVGQYYLYLKVDGVLIEDTYLNVTEDGNYTSSSALCEVSNVIRFGEWGEGGNVISAIPIPETYEDYDDITYEDLYIAGYPAASSGIDLGSTREYTYNATSESKSAVFKFRWTAGAEAKFALFFDYWGNYAFGASAKAPNGGTGGGVNAGENGAWHIDQRNADNIVQMTEPIAAGDVHDIEYGRLKVKTGDNAGKYYVYLKVDGELIKYYYIEATEELTNKILFVSSTSDNYICATPENYVHDEITYNDLYIAGYPAASSGIHLGSTREYTYNATSETYSTAFKFRWTAGASPQFSLYFDYWGNYPFGLAVKGPNSNKGGGATAGENGAWHLNPAMPDNIAQMTEPIVEGQSYDIEIGRIKVRTGENRGKYNVYLKVDGEDIYSYYVEATDELTNKILFVSSTEDNFICATPEEESDEPEVDPNPDSPYYDYDELTFDDLYIGDISMSGMEMDGSRNYTYNATSPSYSMKLKFRWIAGSERRFTVFLDDWVFPFSFAAKVPGQQFGAETGENGAWHINPANADLMVNMDEPIVTGQAYDIEIGRLKVSSGANEGKYKVYLMVNGEEIKHYYYDGVSNGAYSGTALSNNIIFSSPEGNKFTATPFVEEYEAYDEIGYEDLKAADGNALGNQTSMSGATIFTYDKTSATGSVIFKYRWKVGTSAKFQMSFDKTPDSSMSYMFGAWLDVPNENYANGQMWLRPGYSSMANLAEILAVGSSHNVEFARLKVTNGSNAGKYYVYIKIDDVLIAEDYVAADVVDANGNYTTEPNNSTIALSNEIYIAFWGTEGNIISPYKELGSNEHDGTRGDFDGDGTISSIDLITLRKILLGINVGDLPNELGDMNVDGEVNILDLIVMKKELVILSDYSRSGSITLGIQEHLLDDESKTATYIADASATLGANAYRLSMPIHKLFYADSSNNAVLREDNMSQLKELVAELKAKGIEEILYVTDSYILPYGYADATKNHNNTVPDPKTEAENYVAWLTVNAEAFKKLAEEVPEIKFFEPYNEINLRTTRLERNGCAWSTTTEEQAAYKFTVTEKAGIMADLCWYISRAVKSVSTSNQVTTPSISVGSNSIIENDFVEAFYNAIESGVYPTNQSLADVRVDNYFTIINVHAYPDYTEDDALFGDNFESNANAEITEWAGYISYVYEVVKAHDDGSSRVWLTETGMTTYDRDMDNVARLIELALEKVDEELTFVDAVYFYKIADVSTEKGISLSETYFGLFNSGDDLDNPYAAKESAKVIYSFFHNGTTDYSALDELVGRYVE